jgi:hypothetical protein
VSLDDAAIVSQASPVPDWAMLSREIVGQHSHLILVQAVEDLHEVFIEVARMPVRYRPYLVQKIDEMLVAQGGNEALVVAARVRFVAGRAMLAKNPLAERQIPAIAALRLR